MEFIKDDKKQFAVYNTQLEASEPQRLDFYQILYIRTGKFQLDFEEYEVTKNQLFFI